MYGPHDMRDSRLRPIQDKVVVNCQYSMAVFRYSLFVFRYNKFVFRYN